MLTAMVSLALLAAPADAFSRLSGTWHSEEDGSKTSVTSRCAPSPAGAELICDQEGTVDGKPFRALSIYIKNSSGKDTFVAIHDGHPWVTEIDASGSTWTYAPGEAKPGEKRWKTTNEFTSATAYVWKVWESTDGEKWTVVKQGKNKRA
jgi:hypothetical protein